MIVVNVEPARAMTRFEWCVSGVLAVEGDRITDDPDDPGGLTKYGISQRAYPSLDIRALNRHDAVEIYRRDYWVRCGAQQVPAPLDYYLFDAAVNQGVGTAIRLLQAALRVPADGVIGPVTIGAAWNSPRAEVAAMFMAERAMRYVILPTFEKYGRGWLKRLFLVAAAAERT